MPYKPKRPCAYPGCGRLAEREQYCAEHKQVVTKRYNQYQRDPASNKRYGRSWKRIRDHYIKAHPLCDECEKNGRIKAAEEVHHILPLSKGGGNETSNLMALCKSCHSKITAESGDRWNKKSLP
ncbi:MAG: HNH endonuclease [Proteocatella sp.]